jgi:hypothetical protein
MQEEMRAYLRTLIKARQLRRIVMVLLSNNLVPVSDKELLARMAKRYQEEVQWKVNLAWDEQVLDKLKQAQKVKA